MLVWLAAVVCRLADHQSAGLFEVKDLVVDLGIDLDVDPHPEGGKQVAG